MRKNRSSGTRWPTTIPRTSSRKLEICFFACVNVSRLLGIDPEEALRVSCDKFIRRFKYIEDKARNMNVKLGDMSLESMDAIWNEAKHMGL